MGRQLIAEQGIRLSSLKSYSVSSLQRARGSHRIFFEISRAFSRFSGSWRRWPSGWRAPDFSRDTPSWVFPQRKFHGGRLPDHHTVQHPAVGFHDHHLSADGIGAARPVITVVRRLSAPRQSPRPGIHRVEGRRWGETGRYPRSRRPPRRRSPPPTCPDGCGRRSPRQNVPPPQSITPSPDRGPRNPP